MCPLITHSRMVCCVGCLLLLDRVEAVNSLAEAAKLISKHSRAKLQVSRSVQQAVLALKPTEACVSHLNLKLQASAEGERRALSM